MRLGHTYPWRKIMSNQSDVLPDAAAEANREIRKIADLKPHPKQMIFGDAPDHEIKELAESIDRRGLYHPIEIMPDGTILKGHQRLRALEHLGDTETEVLVRNDLVGDELSADREWVEDNLLRRQLGKLALARAYAALLEIWENEPSDSMDENRRCYPIQSLALRLGCSRKNLRRYLSVLDTPREVQEAFDQGDLLLDHAARVANLPADRQREIANAIRDGGDPRAVVQDFLATQSVKKHGLGPHYRKWLNHMKTAHETLAGCVGQLSMADVRRDDLQILGNANDLIGQLSVHIQQRQQEQEENLAAALDRIDGLVGADCVPCTHESGSHDASENSL